MRASLKLGLSFLIHAETSKGVNSIIWGPYRVFPRFRISFVKVRRPFTAILYKGKSTRVSLPDGMHAHGQHLCMHMRASKHTDSNSFSYLKSGSSPKASLMIPMTYRITQDILKLRFSSIKDKKKREKQDKIKNSHEL